MAPEARKVVALSGSRTSCPPAGAARSDLAKESPWKGMRAARGRTGYPRSDIIQPTDRQSPEEVPTLCRRDRDGHTSNNRCRSSRADWNWSLLLAKAGDKQ